MPKLIISIDDAVIREVQLTKARTSLGRRPYNDIVIDNLAVSGEHAVLHLVDATVFLEDLNSTNGSYVNSQPVSKQALQHGDQIEMGKYKIRFEDKPAAKPLNKVVPPASLLAPSFALTQTPFPDVPAGASVKVLTGPAAGRELHMVKVVTTVGKPGEVVAAITRGPQHYTLSLIEGNTRPTVNGTAVGLTPTALHHGDLIDIAGSQLQFSQL